MRKKFNNLKKWSFQKMFKENKSSFFKFPSFLKNMHGKNCIEPKPTVIVIKEDIFYIFNFSTWNKLFFYIISIK